MIQKALFSAFFLSLLIFSPSFVWASAPLSYPSGSEDEEQPGRALSSAGNSASAAASSSSAGDAQWLESANKLLQQKMTSAEKCHKERQETDLANPNLPLHVLLPLLIGVTIDPGATPEEKENAQRRLNALNKTLKEKAVSQASPTKGAQR